MDDLRIKVYGSRVATKPLLERVVKVHSDVKLDYDSIFIALRCLFGKNCVITFELY